MTACATADEPMTLPSAIHELLAARGLGESQVRFAVPSTTWIDTGGWLRGGRVWAAIVGDRFVLAAAGPRPYVRDLPVAVVSRAVYNHVTGQLGFPPVASGTDIPPVGIDPLTARKLVSFATSQPSSSSGHPSSFPGTHSDA